MVRVAPRLSAVVDMAGTIRSESYKSSGFNPVRFAIRASIAGPISSSSWNANTKSGKPDRDNVRWEPDWRLTLQPMRNNAAITRRAFVAGQLLKQLGTLR